MVEKQCNPLWRIFVLEHERELAYLRKRHHQLERVV